MDGGFFFAHMLVYFMRTWWTGKPEDDIVCPGTEYFLDIYFLEFFIDFEYYPFIRCGVVKQTNKQNKLSPLSRLPLCQNDAQSPDV